MTSSLKHQRDRFVAFAFAAADLLIEVGSDNRVSFAAGAAQGLLGAAAQAQIGRPVLELFPVSEHGLLAALLFDRELYGRFGPIALQVRRGDGSAGPALLSGYRLPERENTLYLALNAATVTRAIDAARDGGTDLLGPEAFAEITAESIKVARGIGQEVRLTLIDMTGVDALRERAGEDMTDRFLAEVAVYLRSRSLGRATARLADAKYGLLHDAAIDPAGLRRRIADMAHHVAPQGPEIAVTGRTIEADADIDEAEMVRALVYTINSFVAGGAREFSIRTMTGAMKAMMDDTLQRMACFKSMVARKAMSLRFQPIVDLKHRRPHHFEVLVRFEGDKSPYELIKFAESMHLVHEMDLAVCERAIAHLENGATGRPITVAVNVSAQSLQNEIFVARLQEMVRAHRSLGRRLIFEITESTEIKDLAVANAVIQELRGLGHEMCLDDFGAGFSSFEYLHALHVDYVKLDGKYVRQVLDSPRDRVMLKAMVGLCDDLGIRTVAEMIETETQAGLLARIGVEFGQGWLFGKPAPVPEIPAAPVALHAPARRAAR